MGLTFRKTSSAVIAVLLISLGDMPYSVATSPRDCLKPFLKSLEASAFVKSADSNLTHEARLALNRSALSHYKSGLEYAKARYGDFAGTYIFDRLMRLGRKPGSSNFTDLIADPGIAIRIEEFAKFVQDQALEQTDPWSARKGFSNKLGKRTVYRALSLSEDEYHSILKEGMKSPGLCLKPEDLPYYTKDQLEGLFRRKLIQAEASPILSFSVHPEVAKSAASPYLYKYRHCRTIWTLCSRQILGRQQCTTLDCQIQKHRLKYLGNGR